MSKLFLAGLLLTFAIITGCSDDDPVTPNSPTTGEVLLAVVAGDSVGAASGFSSKIRNITSGTLDFTDRDSARITFYYSGQNNAFSPAILIYYKNGSDSVFLYDGNVLTPTVNEQYAEVTLSSPGVNAIFYYSIGALSSPGFSFFKFRDLKIYKK
jgi:hypothetical protein